MTTPVNYNDILSAYGAYAPAIRPYLAYGDALPEIRNQLTKTTRIVFLDLVSRTNLADAKKPIMVRVDRTAERLGISEKSVSRTIRLMRKNGWIEASQHHDGRNNNGEFAWREYIVTTSLRELLRMPQDDKDTPKSTPPSPPILPPDTEQPAERECTPGNATTAVAAPVPNLPQDKQTSGGFDRVHKALAIVARRASQQAKQPRDVPADDKLSTKADAAPADNSVHMDEKIESETNLSDGPIYAVNKVFLKKEASLQSEALKKEASFEKPSETQNTKTRPTVRLPADLVEMMELLDILPEGICSLMGLAKRTGQRLQDIWKAKKEVLLNSGAKNGRAVKYVRFLLNCGEDFSYIARTKIDAPKRPTPPQSQAETKNNATDTSEPAIVDNASQKPVSAANGVVGLNLIAIAEACRHKRFQHVSKGIRVRVFDGAAEVIAGAKTVILAGWDQMQYLYRGIALGDLVEVRV